MLIGYARVSTLEQNLDLQENALEAAGCKKVYTDKTSGTKAERPGLEKALADVRSGDSLVVWKLDRLGRSLKHPIETAGWLGSVFGPRFTFLPQGTGVRRRTPATLPTGARRSWTSPREASTRCKPSSRLR